MTVVAFLQLKTTIKIICILDSASATTTIDMEFAEIMGIPLSNKTQKNFTYIDRKASMETASCEVTLSPQYGGDTFTIECTAIKGFSENCHVWPWSIFKNRHEHLKHIDIPSYPEPPIGRILIGVDNPDLLVITQYERSRHQGRPIAAKTPLGWAFFGPDPPGEFSKHMLSFQETKHLSDIINRQFEIENIGAKEPCQPYKTKIVGPKHPDIWSPRERLADALMEVTLEKSEPPHLTGKIPWKENHEAKLCSNSRAVEARQNRTHTASALEKKGLLIAEVDEIIKNYILKDYIEEVPPNMHHTGWYLPFFEVINRAKSTPIRLVFDAKAKHKDTSLNQQIMDNAKQM